jgi:ubiquinone/menaquinone biosynthesis C-methylase UbiE
MKDQYKNIAKWYDKIFEPLNSGLRNIGLKMFPVEAGMNVLDIGCGTGAHLKIYQNENCNIYGVDMSAAMIEMARLKLGEKAILIHGSATELNFGNVQFDLILCSTVLHEMSQNIREKVLSEAKGVLKDNGLILLIDFHPGPIKKFRGVYSKIIITIAEILAGRDHYRNYRHFLKNGGLPGLIKSLGLQIDAQKIVSGGNFGLFLLKK